VAEHHLADVQQLVNTYLTVKDDLDITQDVVAYCRGPYCVLAFDAVKQLCMKGITAQRLEDGFQKWKSVGLPVEK